MLHCFACDAPVSQQKRFQQRQQFQSFVLRKTGLQAQQVEPPANTVHCAPWPQIFPGHGYSKGHKMVDETRGATEAGSITKAHRPHTVEAHVATISTSLWAPLMSKKHPRCRKLEAALSLEHICSRNCAIPDQTRLLSRQTNHAGALPHPLFPPLVWLGRTNPWLPTPECHELQG